MKKIELEKMLMNPDGLKKLSERAKTIREKEGMTGRDESNPVEQHLRVKPSDYEVRPTEEEIKANSDDFLVARPLLPDISHILHEFEKEDPKNVLSILTKKCKESPTVENQLLVEDAINRICCFGVLDNKAEKLIDKAIGTLTTENQGEKKEGGIGKQEGKSLDSIWSRVYRNPNFSGNSAFLHHGPSWVYRLYDRNFLLSVQLHGFPWQPFNGISSLWVQASPSEVGGTVLLFSSSRFRGRYAMFPTTPRNPTQRNEFPFVGNFINNRTSSILIVRRYNNEITIRFVQDYPGDLIEEIKEFVSGIERVSPRGYPILTWDMWPSFDKKGLYTSEYQFA